MLLALTHCYDGDTFLYGVLMRKNTKPYYEVPVISIHPVPLAFQFKPGKEPIVRVVTMVSRKVQKTVINFLAQVLLLVTLGTIFFLLCIIPLLDWFLGKFVQK
jgi:hypothetical protein